MIDQLLINQSLSLIDVSKERRRFSQLLPPDRERKNAENVRRRSPV